MKLYLILILTCFFNSSFGQSADSSLVKYDKNLVYVELLGNSFIYGINYERTLNTVCNYTVASSIGYAFSSSKIGAFNDVVIPFEIKMYNRIAKKNHFEFGLGATYYYDKDRPANIVEGIEQKVNKHRTLLFGRVGYRYSSNKGFIFRVGFTPFYLPTSDEKIIPFGGISFGYRLN